MTKLTKFTLCGLLLAAMFALASSQSVAQDATADANTVANASNDNFSRDRLVAWCIVPFDANKRNPEQRVAMLQRLGLKRVAYDWRDEHVASFEEEIQQYQRHGLEFFAFWSWHDDFARLVKQYKIHPQFWITNPSPAGETQAEKVKAAAESLLPLVEKTKQIDCQLGLYNHGGWGGEPENLVAVCKYLREVHQAEHVGIVYNMHHGHEHVDRFPAALELMQPYLFCLNLNGMNDAAEPKILPIGSGQHESELIAEIRRSNYTGPIGILDHRPEIDSEESLRANLDGLGLLLKELDGAKEN
jgi:hypothetical protein